MNAHALDVCRSIEAYASLEANILDTRVAKDKLSNLLYTFVNYKENEVF